MNSKERIKITLDHKEPDRVPKYVFFTPEISRELYNILGLDMDEVYALDIEIGNDILINTKGISNFITYTKREKGKVLEINKAITPWGLTLKNIDHRNGTYTEIVGHPLSDIKKYDSYKFPNILEVEDFNSNRAMVNNYGKDYAIVAGVPATIFEAAWYLRGFENLFIDLKKNIDFVSELMDKIVDCHLILIKELVKIGCDIIWLGDDLGHQEGMLISPEIYRKLLKPKYAYIFEEIKRLDKNVKIAFHSDGYIEPIIPDFIDIGLDILQAIQPQCMNPAKLKRMYGSKLSFWGTLDVQYTMQLGTAKEVVSEIRERISTIAPGGGFIISPSHRIQPGDPRSLDNVFLYYWAVNKYGKYSILS